MRYVFEEVHYITFSDVILWPSKFLIRWHAKELGETGALCLKEPGSSAECICVLLFPTGWKSPSTASTVLFWTLIGCIALDILWIVSVLDAFSFVYHGLHTEEVHCINVLQLVSDWADGWMDESGL